MASVVREQVIRTSAVEAWDAVADFGRVHERLVPGFVTACEVDGDVRTVTFASGVRVRERLVAVDARRRRLVYTNELEGVDHHSASVEVHDLGDGTCRFVWITDVLPDAAAPMIGEAMSAGMEAVGRTLGAPAGRLPA